MPEMIKIKMKMIGVNELEEKVEEILSTLTDDFGMSTECLSNLLGVKNDGHKFEIPKLEIPTGHEYHSFMFLLLMLDNISNEEPDFKFKAFLEVLIEVHKISADTIAKFAKNPKAGCFRFHE